jgi:iron complex transport system substrate-binding protein
MLHELRPGPSRPSRVRMLDRRSFVAGAAGLLGLAACGDSDASTRTVNTARGPVKAPAAPKRVVAASPSVASYMWDVGVAPVGVYELDFVELSLPSHHVARFRRTPQVKIAGKLDVQPSKVADLRPDLVVGFDGMTGMGGTTYAELTKIAPTVLLRHRGDIDAARQIAALLDRTAELSRLEAAGRATSARIRATYGGEALAERRFVRVRLDGAGKGLLDVFSGIEEILVDPAFAVGMPPDNMPSPRASTPPRQELSYREMADRLSDADAIISDPATVLPVTRAFERPEFKRLEAVRDGRLVLLPASYQCVSQILVNLRLLEDVLKKMRG